MILVDERVGSRELLQSIRSLGVEAELAGRLDADFQFEGIGEDEQSILVGIERKDIGDMLTCVRDDRFLGSQFITMCKTYAPPCRMFLVIEGPYRRGRETGFIEVPSGRGWVPARGSVRYAELDHYRMRLADVGLESWRTFDEYETSAWIAELYKHHQQTWQERLQKMSVVYAPPPVIKPDATKGHRASMFRRREPNFKECVAAQQPGIDGKAIEIAELWPSARVMANAGADEWIKRMRAAGFRIGKVSAQKIVDAWTAGELEGNTNEKAKGEA